MSEYIVNMSGNWSGKLTEIVRCRDCRYTGGEVDRGYFKGSCFCSMTDRYVGPHGFCAWGERKTINKTDDFVTHGSDGQDGEQMSEYTWRELERADMDTAAAHAVEMENRAGQDSGRMSESNYEKLFSTPERAARTLALQCFGATSDACDTCVFGECDGKLRNSGAYPTVYDTLLEWLRGDAE